MKQIQITSFGQPSAVARCVEVPDVGEPAAWEVVVDIEAFPINMSDLAMMAGRYGILPKLPSVVGMEAVGRVSRCGTSVTTFVPGDRVVMLANNNWAERRKVPATTVHRVSSELDPIQLSMLKVNPATALMLLTNVVELSSNDWILQTAPLGGVGQCVIQLAKAMGVNTINVVRNDEAKAKVLALGGTVAVDNDDQLPRRVKEIVGYDNVQLAIDAVAGPGIVHLAKCLSDGGLVVNYGMLSGEECRIGPESTIFHNISLRGFWLSKLLNRMPLEQRTNLFNLLCSYIADGKLLMSVDSIYPLHAIGDALHRAEQNGRNGKVIVQVADWNRS